MRIWKQPKTRLIPYEPLNYDAIKQAFRVGPTTPWFVAVIQLLDQHRDDILDAAHGNVASNNSMAVAGPVVAGKAIQDVIETLQNLREEANKLT